jgi:sodium/potassium-transporting ATPase subunit alpha
MISSQSFVLRDSTRTLIESTNLVPGDLIYVKSGDRVPADSILFYAKDLMIDGSNLTGETDLFRRNPEPNGSPIGKDPFDCCQVLFSTDIVASGLYFLYSDFIGEGYAIVIQTGEKSIAGKIRKLSSRIKPKKSALSLEINRFCKSIAILAVVTSIFFFIWALARGRNFTYAITFGVGILIGWIPQGLPFTVTMLLSTYSGKKND